MSEVMAGPAAARLGPAGRGGGGPASQRVTVAFGFWIFLLSDIVMFSAMFAAYAVLSPQTAGGPRGHDLFDLGNAAIETGLLLMSTYVCALAALAVERRRMGGFYAASLATFLLGAGFLALELREFAAMAARGAGPGRSAFLSAFFSLVGLHGAHVAAGLLWLVFGVVQVAVRGPRDFVLRRLHCFALFWHALDIIWVGLVTLVYLMGAR